MNFSILDIAYIGTIGGLKNLQGYRNFGMPKVVFVLVFFCLNLTLTLFEINLHVFLNTSLDIIFGELLLQGPEATN